MFANRSRPLLAALALTGITACATTPATSPSPPVLPPSEPEKAEAMQIPAIPKAPSRGGRDAKVVIEYFSDFECPFSRRHAATMKALLDVYGDQIRIVWRNQPLDFHPHAHLSAEAAREVLAQQGMEGFWRFHDTLFQNQRALTRADLENYAQAQGVDMERFRRALDEHLHAADVDVDIVVGNSVGADGTPTSFINGRRVDGAQSLEVFKSAINAALAARR
jgi:protein-disulfide isomerase